MLNSLKFLVLSQTRAGRCNHPPHFKCDKTEFFVVGQQFFAKSHSHNMNFLTLFLLIFIKISVSNTNRVYRCNGSSDYDQITCLIIGFKPDENETYTFVDRRPNIRKVIFENSNVHRIPPVLFNGFKHMEILVMNRTGINDTDLRKIGFASTLKQLILPENQIKVLYDESFKTAPNLEVIDLSKNLITDVGRTAFKGIDELRTLNLEKNQISTLHPDVFKSIPHLYRLDLGFNNISTLDKTIFYPFRYLRELILKNNQLTKFHVVFEVSSLTKLIINQNKVKSFSLDAENQRISNASLTLQAIDNQIEYFYVSEKFQVTHLHLYKNNLKDYALIFNFHTLKSLSLSSNHIGLIDRQTFQKLVRLEELYLSRCNLFFSDPDTFQPLKRLKKLDIGYNDLRFMNFMDLRQMKNLEVLAIHSNHLSDIDVHALKISLPNLKKIMITGNNFLCSTLDRICVHLERANIEPALDFKTLKKVERAQIHCTPKLDTDKELERISERLNYVEGKLNIAVEAIERSMLEQMKGLSEKFCLLERSLPNYDEAKALRRESLCSY